MHIWDVGRDETLNCTISFSPVTGELGDTVSVDIITMLRPRFVPTGVLLGADRMICHSLHPVYPSTMKITAETGLTEPDICTDYKSEIVTEEFRKKYDKRSWNGGTGTNELDSTVYLEALKNDVIVTPADRYSGAVSETPFTQDDSLTLCMYGGGSGSTYRVSAYLDHELIRGAFDGADYIDLTPSRDTICKKQIAPELLDTGDGKSHFLYFIAISAVRDPNAVKWPIKSDTVLITNE